MADKGFYVMSLKWTSGDHITWWGPDNSGYTTDLARAGIYTAEQITKSPGYYDSGRRDDGTLAVPVEAAERFVKTYRPVPNRLSVYKALRAARNRARRRIADEAANDLAFEAMNRALA